MARDAKVRVLVDTSQVASSGASAPATKSSVPGRKVSTPLSQPMWSRRSPSYKSSLISKSIRAFMRQIAPIHPSTMGASAAAALLNPHTYMGVVSTAAGMVGGTVNQLAMLEPMVQGIVNSLMPEISAKLLAIPLYSTADTSVSGITAGDMGSLLNQMSSKARTIASAPFEAKRLGEAYELLGSRVSPEESARIAALLVETNYAEQQETQMFARARKGAEWSNLTSTYDKYKLIFDTTKASLMLDYRLEMSNSLRP